MTQRFSIYRRLFAYLRPYPWHVVAAYGGMLFATLLNLFVPQIIKQAIDQGLDEGNASQLFWAAAPDPGYRRHPWYRRLSHDVQRRVDHLPRGL